MAALLLLSEKSLMKHTRDQCCWEIWGTYVSSKFLLKKALPPAETSHRYTKATVGALLPALLKLVYVAPPSKAQL